MSPRLWPWNLTKSCLSASNVSTCSTRVDNHFNILMINNDKPFQDPTVASCIQISSRTFYDKLMCTEHIISLPTHENKYVLCMYQKQNIRALGLTKNFGMINIDHSYGNCHFW